MTSAPRPGLDGRVRGRGPIRPALRRAAAAAVVAAAVALSVGEARGQGPWTVPGPGGAVWLDVAKPANAEADPPFLSTAWYLGGRLPLGETTALVGEIPLAIAGEQEIALAKGRSFTQDAEAALGNPYVGLALGTRSPLSWELGLRLPVADGGFRAIAVGQSADAVDRLEAWVPTDFVPLVGAVDYVVRAPSGLLARARGGSTLWIPAGGGDMEMNLQYGAQIGWEGRVVRALGGLTGRFLATGPGGLTARTLHQLGGAARLLLGRVEPGVRLRVPLDEEFADVVFGVSVAIRLR